MNVVILSIVGTAVGTVVATVLLGLPARLRGWQARRSARRAAPGTVLRPSARVRTGSWNGAVATPGSYAERRMRTAIDRGLSPADYARRGLRSPSS